MVTRTPAKIGARSYPINAIASVVVVRPRRWMHYAAAALVVLFSAPLMAINLMHGMILPDALVLAGILLVGLVIGLWGYLLPYGLLLRTSSGEQRALASRDANFLQRIKRAIEQAVSARG